MYALVDIPKWTSRLSAKPSHSHRFNDAFEMKVTKDIADANASF
jgi:hypothetical protein